MRTDNDQRRATTFLVLFAALVGALWLAGSPRFMWRTLDVATLEVADLPALDGTTGFERRSLTVPLPARPWHEGWAGRKLFARASAEVIAIDTSAGRGSSTPTRAEAHAAPHAALALLRLRDDVGGILDWRSFAIARRGSSRGAGAVALPVPPAARTAEIVFVARPGTSSWIMPSASLEFSIRSAAWAPALGAIVPGLAALGAAALAGCIGRVGARPALVVAAVLGALLIGVALSRAAPWGGAAEWMARLVVHVPWLDAVPLRPAFGLGHVVAFLVLTRSAAALRRPLGVTRGQAVAWIVLVASASEALQRHLPDRDPSFQDVGMDLMGAALGAALWRCRRSPRNTAVPTPPAPSVER